MDTTLLKKYPITLEKARQKFRSDHKAYYTDLMSEYRKYQPGAKVVLNWLQARKYACPDAFFDFCVDIMGFKDMTPRFHGPICRHVTSDKRYRMLQAARGTFKSSVATIAYSCWLVGREYTLTGAVNIRILIASEGMVAAKKFMRAIRMTMEHNQKYRDLFGEHKGDHHRKTTGRVWSDESMISQYRTNFSVGEPTISAASIEAPRHGFHYEVIIPDDLETERKSASADQIDKCWDFYRLLHSLLEPLIHKGNPLRRVLPYGPILQLVSTRWHHDDIYARILEADKEEKNAVETYEILIKPAINAKGEYAFPERLNEDTLQHIKHRQGPMIFSAQYMLNPTPDESKAFKKEWINYATPQHYNRPNVRTYMGIDLAYTEQRKLFTGESARADFTCFIVADVDDMMNFIIRDWYRERVNKREAIEAMFGMYKANGCNMAVLQKFDRIQIEETVEHYEREINFHMNKFWVSYPGGQTKHNRIETTLVPKFASNRIWLQPGMKWFEDELLSYPRQRHDDGMDALCNIIKVAKAPTGERMPEHSTPVKRHIEGLKRGKLIHLDGKTGKKPNPWHIFRD